jgi:3-hydroxybutyryl-CoA dehydrogenase
MKILVIGEDEVVTECKAKFGDQHNYHVTNSHLEARKMLGHMSLVFDFILEEDITQYQLLEDCPVPLFISTAKSSLAGIVGETSNPVKPILFGFNGLPTFVNRATFEVTMIDKKHSEKLREICEQLGTSYEVVEDLPGMVTPRIVCMIINEAYCTIEDNTATAGNIDIAMKLGTNYPHGPIEWSKRIGLKNVVDVLDAVYKHSGNERYRICELLREEARREM